MEIPRMVAFGIVTALLSMALRMQGRHDAALLVGMAGGGVLLLWITTQMNGMLENIKKLADAAQVHGEYVAVLGKVFGISVMAEFGTQVCLDAQEGLLAHKIELGGRVAVLALCLPVLGELLFLVLELLQW